MYKADGVLLEPAALRFVVGSNAFAGKYDANGNLVYRVVNGLATMMSYDAENRLVSVSGGVNAVFIYDGDGNRVKSTISGVTTAFMGNHTEWEVNTSSLTRYYYAGSTRVAMRKNNTVYYLLSDHLGSTSVTTDQNGQNPVKQLYSPWGEVRYSSGTLLTKYTYTGQYSNVGDFGLMYYNARWYDPYLNRWTQPDSIVPDPYKPLAYDRYSYVANNPLKYNDPSGHCWGVASGIRGLASYDTTCNNLDMALTIAQSDQATIGQKVGAIAYIGAEGLAHTTLVLGSVACLSNVAGCVAGAKTVLGIGGTAAGLACADGDCNNELINAYKIGNTTIESVTRIGKIESQFVSKANILGIKVNGNMGDLSNPEVQSGLNIINRITSNADRIWRGTWKNREVYEYISNGIGVIRDAVSGELISIVSRVGSDLQKLQSFVDNGSAEWLK